jgi:hypothetical protein
MSAGFAFVLVVVAFFLPGVKFGSVPIPFVYLLAAAYVYIYNPAIPRRYLAIFALATTYLSVIAAITATGDTGSSRDLFYSLLFLGELGVFCALRDLFDRGYGSTIIQALIVCAGFNLFLMFLQALNPGGIDELLRPLWRAPLYIFARGDDADLGNADVVQARPYGLLPGFNIAGLALYLAFRAAHVYTGRTIYRLLCLVTVVLATARMLTILFMLYEVLLPLLNFKKKSRTTSFSLLALASFAIGVAIMVSINPNYFIGTFYQEIALNSINSDYSVTNRLETLNWALENWGKILTFGGVPSDVFRNFSRAVDSELVLRSMQFGLMGFVLIIAMIYSYFHKYKSYDTFFLLAVMLWTSLTSSAASNFFLCPFLLIYGFACRAAAKSWSRSDVALGEPCISVA